MDDADADADITAILTAARRGMDGATLQERESGDVEAALQLQVLQLLSEVDALRTAARGAKLQRLPVSSMSDADLQLTADDIAAEQRLRRALAAYAAPQMVATAAPWVARDQSPAAAAPTPPTVASASGCDGGGWGIRGSVRGLPAGSRSHHARQQDGVTLAETKPCPPGLEVSRAYMSGGPRPHGAALFARPHPARWRGGAW
jgi:hypothetical protein